MTKSGSYPAACRGTSGPGLALGMNAALLYILIFRIYENENLFDRIFPGYCS
jgi:hypothetical protein